MSGLGCVSTVAAAAHATAGALQPMPSTLNPHAGATAKDAEPLEELAGEYCARAFFSRNWQLREAALTYLAQQVKDGQVRA